MEERGENVYLYEFLVVPILGIVNVFVKLNAKKIISLNNAVHNRTDILDYFPPLSLLLCHSPILSYQFLFTSPFVSLSLSLSDAVHEYVCKEVEATSGSMEVDNRIDGAISYAIQNQVKELYLRLLQTNNYNDLYNKLLVFLFLCGLNQGFES